MQKYLLLLFTDYSYINNLTQVNVTIYTSKESLTAINHKEENHPRYKDTVGDAVRCLYSESLFSSRFPTSFLQVQVIGAGYVIIKVRGIN